MGRYIARERMHGTKNALEGSTVQAYLTILKKTEYAWCMETDRIESVTKW